MKHLGNLKPEDLLNKTIFIRVDFNVPLKLKEPGRYRVTDDERIRRFLDTSFKRIHKLTRGNCRIIIGSHLGRPHKHLEDASWDGIFNLQFVCAHFETLLKKEYEDSYIVFPPESMDSHLQDSIEMVKKNLLPLGGIKFLPNLRYLFQRDISYRDEFVKDLAKICDVFINCAFGTSHRETRSIIALPKLMKKRGKLSVAGILLKEEISRLGEFGKRILKRPEETALIAGGSKVSDKIGIIMQFTLSRIGAIILGGKMVNSFLLTRVLKNGKGKIPLRLKPKKNEEEAFRNDIRLADEILNEAKKNNVDIIFPVDYKVSPDFDSPGFTISSAPDFDRELQLDIGQKTIKKLTDVLMNKKIKNIFWNGPLGAFDHPSNRAYSEGSVKVAKCLFNKCIRNKDALVVIGGGDTASVMQEFDLHDMQKGFVKELNKVIADNVNHNFFKIKFSDHDLYTLINYFAKNFFISTGGGASLQFLEAFLKDKGKKSLSQYLPGTQVL